MERADCAEAGAEAVHVVHEVEGVDDGENPQHGDGIAEQHAGDKERDAFARGGDGNGDEQLADEFRERVQFVLVVQASREW